MNTKIPGQRGEALAFNYLIENNYKILNTNFSCKLGEIDIIAQKDDYIIFVEVKARSFSAFGLPREAVTYQKQQHINKFHTSCEESTMLKFYKRVKCVKSS